VYGVKATRGTISQQERREVLPERLPGHFWPKSVDFIWKAIIGSPRDILESESISMAEG
jgi:hypothetical protein